MNLDQLASASFIVWRNVDSKVISRVGPHGKSSKICTEYQTRRYSIYLTELGKKLRKRNDQISTSIKWWDENFDGNIPERKVVGYGPTIQDNLF